MIKKEFCLQQQIKYIEALIKYAGPTAKFRFEAILKTLKESLK